MALVSGMRRRHQTQPGSHVLLLRWTSVAWRLLVEPSSRHQVGRWLGTLRVDLADLAGGQRCESPFPSAHPAPNTLAAAVAGMLLAPRGEVADAPRPLQSCCALEPPCLAGACGSRWREDAFSPCPRVCLEVHEAQPSCP